MPEHRVGYVLKRYPRLSETFILNEILAHEAAGLELHIFSLRLPEESCTHEDVARVRAQVHYLPDQPVSLREVGAALIQAADLLQPEECEAAVQNFKPTRSLWHARQVARIAGASGITHLHAHFATEAASVARVASLFGGMPYTLTAHAKDIFHESVEHDNLQRLASDAAGIITVSDFNVSFLREVLGAGVCPIHRLYNGLDLSEFPFSDGAREPGLIVAVGRLVEKKGFDDLVRACVALSAAGRNYRCVIIGDGDQAELIRTMIQSDRLSDRVEMLGALPRAEVKAWMTRASVLAAPCVVGADGNRDGLPTVLLEAMALGTPCVSTPVTGIPEVVRDGETGLLVPERDPKALATALGRLLDDQRATRRLAQSARSLIEASFNIHRNTEQLRELFAGSAVTGAA